MNYAIIGTAGHVDHGKTALIEALTGFIGDTLEEEKRRGITINLSFSSMQNASTNVAFIDVPGHEKLLKNMIAGAFGFDGSLVVVDANEGIMPQTKEHLEILNLLHVKNIIVALTKKDLATPEVIEQRKYEITEHFKGLSNLKLVHIIPVSIYDKASIETLKNALFCLAYRGEKKQWFVSLLCGSFILHCRSRNCCHRNGFRWKHQGGREDFCPRERERIYRAKPPSP